VPSPRSHCLCSIRDHTGPVVFVALGSGGMSTPSLICVDERGGFSGRSGLSLCNRREHAFTEIQAFPLSHAPVGISELAHLDGELA
jgi:hypothetical protein